MNFFCPLASGSKGNSIFFKTSNTKILIDAGLSYVQLKTRLEKINQSIDEIDAVLITHEHTDHISGLKLLTERHNIPVIANSDTAKAIYNTLHTLPRFKVFTTSEEFEFKDLKIFPFSIKHDTLDPVGFIINYDNLKFGFCTDIGFVTTLIKTFLKECNYLYLESNHHVPYVHASKRSYVYKQRVLSRQGHLSNDESISLLDEIIHENLKHICMAHISEECNSKKLILDLLKNLLEKKKIDIKYSLAYQDKVSEVIKF